MMRTKMRLVVVSVCAAAAICGCTRTSDEKESTASEAKAAVPPGLFSEIRSAEAKDVHEIKQAASAGDEVVIRGNIAGGKDPFVSGKAMFMLADRELPLCSVTCADSCPTPWDLCCEPKERLIAHTVTIEVDDSAGKVLSGSLRDVGGLAPGKAVIVRGKVSQKPSPQVMVIRAEKISVGT